MNPNLTPSSQPAPKLGSPEQFNRRQTRLRDLKAQDAWLDLPPLFEQEDKAVQRSAAIDARLGTQLRQPEAPTGAGAPSPKAALKAAELAAIDRDLNAQKSRARIEKLKDVQAGLEMIHERLFEDSDPSSESLAQLRSLLQAARTQLMAIYDGQLAIAQGMVQIRPLLVNCVEKLDCVQPGRAGDYGTLRERDASMIEALRAPNSVPVMEKAALLALTEIVDRVLELYFALTVDQAALEDEALLRQHQPSLQLLQRAGRSQQKMLAQLTALHGQLGDLQGQMSLKLLKSSLQQLNGRAQRELQGICEIIDVHLPGLKPLVPPLKTQHQRLEQTSTPEFLTRQLRYSLTAQTPATPGLPEAIQPMLDDYTHTTDKVVVAFEALTAQSQEKDQTLTLENELADLDAMFGI